MPICSSQSGRASSNALNQNSVCERTLVKTRVVPAFSICSTTSSTILPPRCPAQGNFSMSLGMSTSTSNFFFKSPSIRTPARSVPRRADWAMSRFPRVADRPHVRSWGFHFRKRASPNSVCTPRLVDNNSCHSSTTTARRLEKACLVSG